MFKKAYVKYIKYNCNGLRFKHLKRHQKPVVCKYRVLFVVYFSHLFLYIKFSLPNHISCALVHELLQSHFGDNWEGTLFPWFHIYYAHFTSVMREIWTLCVLWITFDHWIFLKPSFLYCSSDWALCWCFKNRSLEILSDTIIYIYIYCRDDWIKGEIYKLCKKILRNS